MKYKRIVQILILLFLILVVIFIFSGIKHKRISTDLTNFEATGKEMVYTLYNKNNKKAILLKCSESKKVPEDKILMKNIQATIFKKGKLEKDIHISGDKGFIKNNLHDFSISKNAKIISGDTLIESKSFYLKDRDILTSKNIVNYKTKTLTGLAKSGMRASLLRNILYFYNTSGIYKKGNRSFDFKTDIMKFRDDIKTLRLHNNSSIKSKEALLRGDKISIVFTDDYKNIKEARSWGNCYFYMEKDSDHSGKEIREINAGQIKDSYDDNGNLEKTLIKEDAIVKIKNKLNTTKISSHLIEIYYNKISKSISNIQIPKPCVIENKGKNNFKITATKVAIAYDKKGEIDSCNSRGSSKIIFEEYKGSSSSTYYNLKNNSIILKGSDSKIVYKNSEFISFIFNIDTKNKILFSSSQIKSIVALNKQNPLFSKAPIFINSENINVSEMDNTVKYEKSVNLFQDDIALKAASLEVKGEDSMVATGSVSLSFKDNEKEVILKGNKLIFDFQERTLKIMDKARIKEGNNILKADLISVQLSKKSEGKNKIEHIRGEKEVIFVNEDLSGSSEKIDWLFEKELVIFRGSAQIKKQSSGITKGNELKLDLKNKKIIIISDDSKRSQTIIE